RTSSARSRSTSRRTGRRAGSRATRSATVSPLIQPCGQSFSKLSEIWRSKFAGQDAPAKHFVRQNSLNFEKDWPQGWIKGDTVAERVAAWKEVRDKLLGLKIDRRWRINKAGPDHDTLFVEDRAIGWDIGFTVFPSLAADTKV